MLDLAKYFSFKRSAGCTPTDWLRHVVKASSPNAAHERTDESRKGYRDDRARRRCATAARPDFLKLGAISVGGPVASR